MDSLQPLLAKTVEGVSLADIDLSNPTYEFRFDYEISELKTSLRSAGQLIPITLTGEAPHLIIVCGFRRVRALREIGEEAGKGLDDITVLAFVRPDLTKQQARQLAWLENEQRQATNPVEKANFIRKMLEEGLQPRQIRDQLGIEEKTYQRYNQVNDMGYHLTRLMVTGEIGLRHALALHKHRNDIEDHSIWLDRITGAERFTAEQLEKELRGLNGVEVKSFELKISQDRASFRLPTVRYSSDTTDQQRSEMIAALQQALRYLEDPSSLSADEVEDTQAA